MIGAVLQPEEWRLLAIILLVLVAILVFWRPR